MIKFAMKCPVGIADSVALREPIERCGVSLVAAQIGQLVDPSAVGCGNGDQAFVLELLQLGIDRPWAGAPLITGALS